MCCRAPQRLTRRPVAKVGYVTETVVLFASLNTALTLEQQSRKFSACVLSVLTPTYAHERSGCGEAVLGV
jgi:hypothetical protein